MTSFVLAVLFQKPIKAPVEKYLEVKDITQVSTGLVGLKTGFGLVLGFEVPGKQWSAPSSVWLTFNVQRHVKWNDTRSDGDYAQWDSNRDMIILYDGERFKSTGTYRKLTETGDNVELRRSLTGERLFAEELTAELPVSTLSSIVASKKVQVQMGEHEDSIGPKAMAKLKQFESAIKSH